MKKNVLISHLLSGFKMLKAEVKALRTLKSQVATEVANIAKSASSSEIVTSEAFGVY